MNTLQLMCIMLYVSGLMSQLAVTHVLHRVVACHGKNDIAQPKVLPAMTKKV